MNINKDESVLPNKKESMSIELTKKRGQINGNHSHNVMQRSMYETNVAQKF